MMEQASKNIALLERLTVRRQEEIMRREGKSVEWLEYSDKILEAIDQAYEALRNIAEH